MYNQKDSFITVYRKVFMKTLSGVHVLSDTINSIERSSRDFGETRLIHCQKISHLSLARKLSRTA